MYQITVEHNMRWLYNTVDYDYAKYPNKTNLTYFMNILICGY